jgi:riboflavin kinase/FMN adenylyltransferase
LIQQATAVAAPLGAPVVALTFEPHPLAILRPAHAPSRLTTAAEKAALLDRAGVDALIVVESAAALLAMSARAFVQKTMSELRPRAFVEGPSFNFGRAREGSIESLRAMGAEFGVDVHVLHEVHCAGIAGDPPVNSSAVRGQLADGRIEHANEMLGRAYRIVGVVVSGDGRGTTIGFPTANLDHIPQLIPAHGVYAGIAQLEDGAMVPAAINIGPQPTFGQSMARVEAHLLGYDGNLRGRRVGLHLMRALRRQEKFHSPEQLVTQLRVDTNQVRELDLISTGSPLAIALSLS